MYAHTHAHTHTLCYRASIAIFILFSFFLVFSPRLFLFWFCFLIYFAFFALFFSTFGLRFVASSLFAPVVVVAVALLVAVVVGGFVSYIVRRVCVCFVSFCSVCCVFVSFCAFCLLCVFVVVVFVVFCSSIAFCSEFWADFYFSVAATASAPDLDLRTAGTEDGSEGRADSPLQFSAARAKSERGKQREKEINIEGE